MLPPRLLYLNLFSSNSFQLPSAHNDTLSLAPETWLPTESTMAWNKPQCTRSLTFTKDSHAPHLHRPPVTILFACKKFPRSIHCICLQCRPRTGVFMAVLEIGQSSENVRLFLFSVLFPPTLEFLSSSSESSIKTVWSARYSLAIFLADLKDIFGMVTSPSEFPINRSYKSSGAMYSQIATCRAYDPISVPFTASIWPVEFSTISFEQSLSWKGTFVVFTFTVKSNGCEMPFHSEWAWLCCFRCRIDRICSVGPCLSWMKLPFGQR
mmetsp:Transcript_27504/g.58463  ORF Transcript_27504/g.58463 Transcript_27504/m.58463 type:complete len:266 (+) Transcript_27504:277-1074(+)